MNHFEVLNGELACEVVPLRAIAEAVGTPVYVYSTATLERHYTVLRDALVAEGLGNPLIAYAVKANSNVAVLRTLGNLGAGADTVSVGEIKRALAAGISPDRIVFSGVGKTEAELAFALDVGVGEINVESEPEMRLASTVAQAKGTRATIAIRVNPDVSAGGHAKISTGKSDNKFGVSFSEAERLYAQASNNAGLKPVGVTCHIGSQITELAPLEQAFTKMRGLVERLRAEGLSVESRHGRVGQLPDSFGGKVAGHRQQSVILVGHIGRQGAEAPLLQRLGAFGRQHQPYLALFPGSARGQQGRQGRLLHRFGRQHQGRLVAFQQGDNAAAAQFGHGTFNLS